MRMITVEEELEQIKAILQAANVELEIKQETSASSLSPIEQKYFRNVFTRSCYECCKA